MAPSQSTMASADGTDDGKSMPTPTTASSGMSGILSWGAGNSIPRPQTPRRNAGIENDTSLLGHARRGSGRAESPDCPPLSVRWFHAIDVPKRKPFAISNQSAEKSKPLITAKKYQPFSETDSKAIEAAYRRIENAAESEDMSDLERVPSKENTSLDQGKKRNSTKIPVNEDYLFDVDIEHRELAPAYWLGPVYNVRRGSWFYSEKPLRPCDEDLAIQIEKGYQRIRPWMFGLPNVVDGSSKQEANPQFIESANPPEKPSSANITDSQGPATPHEEAQSVTLPAPEDRTVHLTGDYKDYAITFEDSVTAYLVANDLYSRISSTMYQRFSGGAHFAGVKIVRGYSEPETKANDDQSKTGETPKSVSANEKKVLRTEETEDENKQQPQQETIRQRLERQVSSLVSKYNPEKEEEETRRRDEQEIRDDYNDDQSQQGREIEHLVLVTHGIGQRLGMRLEGVNFIHDVNALRKTIKVVYNDSEDLQALNGDVDKPVKNSRVQVLPIVWRHLLDFPRHSIKHTRREHGLGDSEGPQDEEYPTLDQITLPGVPAIRNLITDLGLDILLYLSPAYKPHITKILLEECNRIHKLFKTRNPSFKGKVSLIGHSLGAAVMFDLLCSQKSDLITSNNFLGFPSSQQPHFFPELQLDFDVEDFYAFGSPIGILQLLKGRTIAARQTPNIKPAQTPFGQPANPFAPDYFEILTSAPKCKQLFNIFHPNDPIAYRMEPLISPAMSRLTPQPLPYTKKSIFSNLPAAPSGLSDIGARVSQNLQGLWNSFSTGLAHNLLNRSLGIVGEDNRIENPLPLSLRRTIPVTPGPITTEAARVAAKAHSAALSAEDAKRLVAEESGELVRGEEGLNPPTLLNTGLETLFKGFQNREDIEMSGQTPEETQAENEEEEKLKLEDQKVRALNKNGRVDYSIQEGAFDISLLASVASHLSYWSDEDVGHFMVSQLLSRHRIMKKTMSP